MTPTTATILAGNARVIASLAGEEGGADYAGAKLSVVALLSVLAAQEAEAGAAVRLAENAAIAAVLTAARPDDDGGADLPESAEPTIAALDAVNATLRRRLIALHEAVEARGDRACDAAILALYRRMAEGRMLVLPPH
ncbi:hypothetical protein [Sphingomonas sp.]|uniref:hypothetical protein n=1 Tax=Sphingomonas sp. TaxID=28214 RepID=UPI003CC525E6